MQVAAAAVACGAVAAVAVPQAAGVVKAAVGHSARVGSGQAAPELRSVTSRRSSSGTSSSDAEASVRVAVMFAPAFSCC